MQLCNAENLKRISDSLRKLYYKLLAVESTLLITEYSNIGIAFKHISEELEEFIKTEDFDLLSSYWALQDFNSKPEYKDFLAAFAKDIRETLKKDSIKVCDISKVLTAINPTIVTKWITYLDNLIAG